MQKNIFLAISVVLWTYLLTTKLRSVIPHNLGHSNLGAFLLSEGFIVIFKFLMQALINLADKYAQFYCQILQKNSLLKVLFKP